MSEGGSTTPAHPNMLRNVLTGVITTVVGASAVYYLGFSKHGSNDSSSGGYLETKEATTQAWKSYVAIENLEYKNTMLLVNHLKDLNSLDEFKDQLTKESNKFSTDIEVLIKKEDIDNAFTSLLKRRLDAEKEALQKWNDFFASSKNIVNSTQPGQERTERVTAEYNKMQTAGNLIVERTKTEITDLAKSLNEKYGQSFLIAELLLFQEEKKNQDNQTTNNGTDNNNNGNAVTNNNNQGENVNTNYNNGNTNYTNTTQVSERTFAGEWDTPGAIITLTSNGQMTWEMNTGQSTSGTWRFYNNQLYMTYPDQYGSYATYIFNLSNVAANSFTMQLASYPYNRYDLTRYQGNQ